MYYISATSLPRSQDHSPPHALEELSLTLIIRNIILLLPRNFCYSHRGALVSHIEPECDWAVE